MFIDCSTTAFMTWQGGAHGNIQFPDGSAEWMPGSNILHVQFEDAGGEFDLSQLVVVEKPTFTANGKTVNYVLSGFSKTSGGSRVDYTTKSVLTPKNFEYGKTTMTIHAMWVSDYIVQFQSDDSSVSGHMDPIVV